MSDLAQATAVILAGGFGTRLRSVVADRPKVLADVAGRPFLAHLLDQLAHAAVRDVVLSTGYMAEQVEAAFGSSYAGLALRYSRETEPLGTGGALALAVQLVDAYDLLVLNGDSYCTFNPSEFASWHAQRGSTASLALVHVDDTARYGSVELDKRDRVVRFEEKAAAVGPGWINAGMYLIRRPRLADLPTHRPLSLEREVFPMWIDGGLFGYRSAGELLDIGTPESYAMATRFLA